MTNQHMTPDQAAVAILLGRGTQAQRDRKLQALYQAVTAAVENRVACPECEHQGPHDENGDRHEPMLCCCECGTHFDAPTTVGMP